MRREVNAMSSTLLTKKKVAEIMRVSERSVDNYRKNEGLQSIKVGRLVRFIEEKFYEWLQAKHHNQGLPSTETDDKKTCGQ
jgi:predicted DNA-binding transcriptional regulator AlpA